MAYSIKIEIISLPINGDIIKISNPLQDYFQFNFVTLRDQQSEVQIGSDISGTIDNFAYMFSNDYNEQNDFTTTQDSTSYTLIAEDWMGWGNGTQPPLVEINNTSGRINVTIEEVEDYLQILNVKPEATMSSCNGVTFKAVCNENVSKINIGTSGDQIIDPESSEVIYMQSFARTTENVPILVSVANALGSEASYYATIPKILNANDFLINIVDSNVYIINNSNLLLQIEYSINGTDYQLENSFENLTIEEYTLYIRDEVGCVVTKTFSIGSEQLVQPYVYLSPYNSIIFKRLVEWGICSNYKNDDNTLSCEKDTVLKHKELQLFQVCDTERTQFRSNADTILVELINTEDNTITELTHVKISNNMNLKDRRDCTIVELDTDLYGIYFTTGNIYDYITGVATGTYDLDGNLPEYTVAGNYIQIDGVFYYIQFITYNYDLDVWQIELNTTNSIALGSNVVSCAYNNENYEIYEFDSNFASYNEQLVELKITNSYNDYEDIVLTSEIIYVKEQHENTIFIEHYNDENSDIFFNNWKHKLRVNYTAIKRGIDNTVDYYKGDANSNVYDIKDYVVNIFKFDLVSRGLSERLILALSNKHVYINEIKYVKSNIEMQDKGDDNDIYYIEASMLRANRGLSIGPIPNYNNSNNNLLNDDINLIQE